MFIKESIIPKELSTEKNAKDNFWDSLARKGVISKFHKIQEGRLIA